ncbi:MAG: riboflavin biosynthesis protein RibF [Spirochaetes bacterium RBG_16_49_21]|nr:MAG: riboflavin biosynthesis protein RibF [Spirochaetes bacterium RBG_16_49_21]
MKIYHHLPENKNIFITPAITIGTFDGVHRGHRKILSALLEVSKKESRDPVVITFSAHPRKVLQPGAPVKIITTPEEKINAIYDFGIPNIILLNFTERMARMRAIDFYNDVLISKLDAKIIVIGYDHAFGNNRVGNYDFLTQLTANTGVEIIRVEEEDIHSKPISSSWIKREIEKGNIGKANSLLGWRYCISGTVIKGKGRGRDLGFPTANIVPVHSDKVVPGDGVYAVRVKLEKDVLKNGILNIGTNPTFFEDTRTIEVHILDFNGIIYDKPITVEFHKRLREEIAFDSKEQLIDQIKRDRIEAVRLLGGKNDQ